VDDCLEGPVREVRDEAQQPRRRRCLDVVSVAVAVLAAAVFRGGSSGDESCNSCHRIDWTVITAATATVTPLLRLVLPTDPGLLLWWMLLPMMKGAVITIVVPAQQRHATIDPEKQ
jgi:hypothetical protein